MDSEYQLDAQRFRMEDNMDEIKEMIEKVVERVTKEDDLKELFEKEPIKAIEKVLGIDLPDEKLEAIVDAVKAKISIDKHSSVAGMFKKLF